MHRFAGWLWSIGGLVVLEWNLLTMGTGMTAPLIGLVLLIVPVAYGYLRGGQLN